MAWTPSPFNLLNGNPFQYLEHAISSTSGTEAFETAIKTWDVSFVVFPNDGVWITATLSQG
jgi:hypothetical protein